MTLLCESCGLPVASLINGRCRPCHAANKKRMETARRIWAIRGRMSRGRLVVVGKLTKGEKRAGWTEFTRRTMARLNSNRI